MDRITPIGNSRETIEGIDPQFLCEKLQHYQQKTWDVLQQIKSSLREGLTEDEARKLALQIFLDLGVSKHWHRPYIRFGKGTALTFHDPMQTDYRLKADDPYYIDLGPAWPDAESNLIYEADVGDTFVFGSNARSEKCAEDARLIFHEARTLWKSQSLSGEQIYQWIEDKSKSLGYQWVEKVDGHRIGDFPHHQYSKERLRNLTFCPNSFLWVLEVQINDSDGHFGAFYEDIL